jgi:putative ABC transport system permease protein
MALTTAPSPAAVEPESEAPPPAVDATRDRPGGTAGRLLRFALANVRRRPERSLLAVAGIALAVAAVVVVRTIAASYQATGADAVDAALGDAPFWVVPEAGVRLDADLGAVVTDGAVPEVGPPDGWAATTVLVGRLPGTGGGADGVALVGRDDGAVRTGEALATTETLDRLGLVAGEEIEVGGGTLILAEAPGSGALLTVAPEVARAAGITTGWITLAPPAGTAVTNRDVEVATGLAVVSDPAQRPADGSGGLVYATQASESRAGIVSFDQKMAALLGGKVTSSALGLVSQIGLVLGFVIAVTTFVAAVHERRREFGIMASVGLTDEVLYFFLVESLLLFVAAYLAGALLGGLVVATVLPSFFTVANWASAVGMVAMYLPALGIVAALVPVHRLVQQRPVALLADEA